MNSERQPLPPVHAGEGEDERPVYVISIAAELAGMHPQTLRTYDRMGLVSPGRAGRSRRYSARDVALLREVARLSQQEGVGLAGIGRILALQQEVSALRAQVRELVDELAAQRARSSAELAQALTEQANTRRRDLVPLPPPSAQQVVVWRRRPHHRRTGE